MNKRNYEDSNQVRVSIHGGIDAALRKQKERNHPKPERAKAGEDYGRGQKLMANALKLSEQQKPTAKDNVTMTVGKKKTLLENSTKVF